MKPKAKLPFDTPIFLNKFRRLGLIDYNGGLQAHSSLLNIVLHD